MTGRIVEITKPGCNIHLEHGFLAVRENGVTIGRIPLDDIDAVISATPGICWSGNVLAALARRAVPVVLIGGNYAPIAHILPIAAHFNQGVIMQAQAESSRPVRKRLWAQIVKAKIEAQAELLKLLGIPAERLINLKAQVKSGDATNREAVAAQYYWPVLMGRDFRRNRAGQGANILLNYGYTILRAAAARAIVSAGLNPSLSLHHVSSGDPLRLADDLMEPFRPAIDCVVYDLVKSGRTELEPEEKADLAATLTIDYVTANGHTPLSHVLVRLAQSLARIFQKQDKALEFPSSLRPVLGQLPLDAP